MDKDKLKPCPFCGSEAHIEKGKVRFKNNKARRATKIEAYFIGCSDPGCILYSTKQYGKLFFTVSKDGIEVMIRRWNRRRGERR
jgi:hypothetical protein